MMASHRRRIDTGFALALVVLLAVAALSYRSARELIRSDEKVSASLRVIVGLEDLFSSIVELETDRRGFALTGDERMLASLRDAELRIAGKLAALQALTADDPLQRARLETLSPFVRAKVAHVLRSSEPGLRGDESRQAAIVTEGTRLRERIRDLTEEMKGEERRLLEARSQASAVRGRTIMLALFAGCAFVAAIVVYALYRTRRDVAERERAETARERFFALSLDMLTVADFQGRIQQLSPGWTKTLGYTEAELESRSGVDFVHPDDVGEALGALEKLRAGGATASTEVRMLARDGSVRWVNWSVSAAPEEGLVYASGRDITERKSTDEALARLNARYQAVLDGATQNAIIACDSQGTIALFNRGAERMLGYTAAELVGKSTPERIHLPAEVARRAEELSLELGRRVEGFDVFVEKARAGGMEEREWTYVRKDGVHLTVRLAVTTLRGPDGRLEGFLGVATDLSDRKQVERLKSEFVSTVSHELRTPLTSIRGALGLVLGGTAGSLSPEARNLMEIAARNSDRLVLLINDILDIEKISSGRMTFLMRPVAIATVVRDAVEASRAFAGGLGVSIRVDEGDDGIVQGDPDRLVQVFTNLLSNAAKFSPAGAEVRIGIARTGESLRVSVSDRGPGIPDAFRARVFEPFAQADGSSSRQKGGTGLGLHISRAIVQRHGGRIEFVSHESRGTTFSVDLPEERFPATETVKAARTAGPSVLVCEDEPDIATLLTLMLVPAGYDVDVARDAAGARALLASRAYSAMTLDLRLPDEDGVALIRELRSQPATRELPIVVVSVHAERGRAELEGGAFGVVDWLEKPVDRARLLAAVQRGVGGTSGKRPRVLYVEDDPDLQRISGSLLGAGVDVVPAGTLEEARRALSEGTFDLVVLDVVLPDGSGLALVEELAAGALRDVPVVIFSSTETVPEPGRHVAETLVKGLTSVETLRRRIHALISEARSRAETREAR